VGSKLKACTSSTVALPSRSTECDGGLIGAVDRHDTQLIVALDAERFGWDQEAVEIGGIVQNILAHLGAGVGIPHGYFDITNQIGRGEGNLGFVDLFGCVEGQTGKVERDRVGRAGYSVSEVKVKALFNPDRL
jgi:hypothetical protein